MFLLNSKNEISTDVYYKDTSTQDYLLYDSAHSESGKKNVSYNLARKIIVFITDPEKVKLRLNGLKTWLKIINILIILSQMLFIMLNCHLLHPSTKIQIIRL